VIAVDAHAAELSERGFTVIPNLYPQDRLESLRAALLTEYEAAGRPPVVAAGHLVEKGSYNTATAAGFAISRILTTRPEVAPLLLVDDGVAVLRRALGDDMRLEIAGGMISDRTRPFFKWHHHLGGVDELRWSEGKGYPRRSTPERVLMLVYLDAIDEQSGSLLVYPRRVTDPVEAPYPIEQLHWEGEVVVHVEPGTAVLLEQTTWHAALPQTRDGLRMFVGFYFAASSAPAPEARDASLEDFSTDVPLLSSVLPRASR